MFKYYIRNLLYITEHKRNVFIEGRKLGLGIIQLLKHDLSKFSKWEFKPYTARFFDKNCKHCMHFYDKNQVSLKKHEIYAKECSAFKRPNNHKIEKDFELAWHHHQQNNKHHWQYWVSNKNGNSIVQEMPLKYLKEMLAD